MPSLPFLSFPLEVDPFNAAKEYAGVLEAPQHSQGLQPQMYFAAFLLPENCIG